MGDFPLVSCNHRLVRCFHNPVEKLINLLFDSPELALRDLRRFLGLGEARVPDVLEHHAGELEQAVRGLQTLKNALEFTFEMLNGVNIFLDTAMQNCTSFSPGAQASCRTGRDNTNFLVSLGSSPSPAPFVAANYCNDLDAHGHTDWYLPAQDELNVLYVNLASDGAGDVTPGNSFGFTRTGEWTAGWYWSSSEQNSFGANLQNFSNGVQGNTNKTPAFAVRCVRRVP